MTECKEKQMLQKNQTKENTFQYTSGMKGNELATPNITSSTNTLSQSSDDTLAVKENNNTFHSEYTFKKIYQNHKRYTTTEISDQLM